MRHALTLLCMAFSSILFVEKAVAFLLLEQNPTPLESASLSVSGDTYQIAGIYHIVDYSKKMESYYGKRVNDDNKDDNGRNCATYGYSSSCPAGQKGTEVTIAGILCYKDCMSCATEGYATSCPSPQIGTLVPIPNGMNCYKDCHCPSAYNRTSQITANASCTSCTAAGVTKWKCECNKGYSLSGDRCVADCGSYPLTGCPTGCNCEVCPQDSNKQKIVSAKEGWYVSGNTCEKNACPSPYICGISSCDEGSSKPNYHKHATAKCGEQVCGYCSCDNNNPNCTAANYPVTSIPLNATKKTECNTGCGSEKITRYTFECNEGYELKNGKCEPKSKTCASGGYEDTIPAGYVCTKVIYEGLTCYDCSASSLCANNYVDSDNIMYNSTNVAVGFKHNSKYYLLDQTNSKEGYSADQNNYCAGNQGEVPASSMTNSLTSLETKLSDTRIKNILTKKYWWVSGTSGAHVLNGTTVGGGSCAGDGHWGHAIANGSCYQFKNTTKCPAGNNYICTQSSLPSTVCVQDCKAEYCPAGYAALGKCSCFGCKNSTSSEYTTLSNGVKCYKCESCPTGSYMEGQCPATWVQGALSATLSDGTKCYVCETCPAGSYREGQCPTGTVRGSLSATLSDGTKCYECTNTSTETSYREYTLEANYEATTSACQTNASRVITASFLKNDGQTVIATASLTISAQQYHSGSQSVTFSAPIPENVPIRLYISENWSYDDRNQCPLGESIYVNGQRHGGGNGTYLEVTLVPYRDAKVRFDLRFGG